MNNIKYNQENDALIIEIAEGKLDDSVQSGDIISHFDEKGKILFIEVLNTKRFLLDILNNILAHSKSPASIN